ncbi:MAG: hypothetical protein QOC57_2200 [Ilumatobacteraceae bacterium]
MPHIVARQEPDRLWYWFSIGQNGAELMRSNIGRPVRAAVDVDLRILKALVATPGVVAVELCQSSRAGDWRSHLTVTDESEYEATSTVWYVSQTDAQSVGELTVAALRSSARSYG